jgi:protein-L-isoaspartate O-methyltransferase
MNKFKPRKEKIRSILGDKYSEEIIDMIVQIPREHFTQVTEPYRASKKPYIGGWDLFDIEYIALVLNQINNINSRGSALVLGSGNGYLLSLLAKQYHEVIGYETNKYLVRECMDSLTELDIDNAITQNRDYYEMVDLAQRYDFIVVNFALTEEPKKYIKLLNENGILLFVLADTDYMWPDEPQRLISIKKTDGELLANDIAEVYIPPVIRKL